MSAPRDYISGCVYCGQPFHVGDNAQCVEPGQFIHLRCLGTWTQLKALEALQQRARVRVVG
jgi:hypothetical protein